jgi:enoyl-CoA hydratase
MEIGTTSLEITGAVALMTVRNPPLNVLSNDVRVAMLAHVNALAERRDVKVLIVRAEGDKAFSVGSNIREFPAEEIGGVAKIRFEQHLLNRLAGLPQVTVAMLNGYVLGGGAELMLACDLRLAGETTQIGFPEIKLGALPAAGGLKRLTREIGPVRAREMILTGATISAARALDLGLVNRVVAAEALEAEMELWARMLCQAPSDALRLAKSCIAAMSDDHAMDSIEADAFATLYRGRNLHEGVAAFLAKRPPHFDAEH